MERWIIDTLRSYLAAAGMTAAVLGGASALVGFSLDLPDAVFQSPSFRLTALLLVIGVTLAIRVTARRAFEAAVANHQLSVGNSASQEILVASACPWRKLVLLHLHFQAHRSSSISV